ncbi:MAG: tetratricopeptide repeat protein [Candidatus Wallbacteria bacterium]|nr:tetratricopeptide repeat protein [Candidatus Wallbacteria bacterium]
MSRISFVFCLALIVSLPLSADKSSIDMKFSLAQLYVDSRQFEKAIEILNQILEVAPDNKKAQSLIRKYREMSSILNISVAETYVEYEQWDKVVEVLENAAKVDPKNSKIQMMLHTYGSKVGKNYSESGERVYQARELEDLVTSKEKEIAGLVKKGELSKAIELLKEVTKLDPTNSRSLYQLGVLYYYNLDFNNAVATFDNFLTLKSEDHGGWLHMGLSLFAIGEKEEGYKSMKKALELKPGDHHILLTIGQCYLKDWINVEAERYLAMAREIKPDDPATVLGLIELKNRDKKFNEAIMMAELLSMQYPDSIHTLLELAITKCLGNDLRKSKEIYESVKARQHRFPVIKLLGGLIAYQEKNYLSARKQLEETIKADRENSRGHYYLARVLKELNHRDLALDELDKALAIEPSHALAKAAKAELLIEGGDQKAAAGIMEDLVRRGNADFDVLRVLTTLLEREGDLKKSVEMCDAALEHADDEVSKTKINAIKTRMQKLLDNK